MRTTGVKSVTTRIITKEHIQHAAQILREGGTLAFPTETVYGLGAHAGLSYAVARVYEAKGRPSFNPLIAHVHSYEAALNVGHFSNKARKLAQAFWPGPLTLVVPLKDVESVCTLARAGLESVGLRVPAHTLARQLLQWVNAPVVAPSANRSGHISPTRVEHVLADLDGRIDAILEGDACKVGVESTIVSCLDAEPILLRAGGVSTAALELVLHHPIKRHDPIKRHGVVVHHDAPLTLIAPGMLTSHYAPRAHVIMNATTVNPHQAMLLFGDDRPEGWQEALMSLNLSESANVMEAGARLFDALRTLDQSGCTSIAVSPIPMEGLGEAINDRLIRASAARS